MTGVVFSTNIAEGNAENMPHRQKPYRTRVHGMCYAITFMVASAMLCILRISKQKILGRTERRATKIRPVHACICVEMTIHPGPFNQGTFPLEILRLFSVSKDDSPLSAELGFRQTQTRVRAESIQSTCC